MTWKFIGSTSTESFNLHGVDIFKYKWSDTGRIATVIDPLYLVSKRFSVYTILHEGREIEFAAGEFSNGVWGIYQSDEQN